jgi:hypothetical protein
VGEPKKRCGLRLFNYYLSIDCIRVFLWREDDVKRRKKTEIRLKKESTKLTKIGGEQYQSKENLLKSNKLGRGFSTGFKNLKRW